MDWRAALVNAGIRMNGSKRHFATVAATRARVAKLQARPKRFEPPRDARRAVDIARREVAGWPVFTVRPSGKSPERVVLYLHGGAYTYEIEPIHWRVIARLARRVPAHLEVPIYPLAPASTAAATVPVVTDLLAGLIAEHGTAAVSVMGDSAGGGLALAAAQQLRDRGGPLPARLVLISPWLDVTLSDLRQVEVEPQDRMIRIPGLRECGLMYAGDLDPRDPRVSPLFGDLHDLPPLDVFTGTADVLNADAHRLVERGEQAGTPVRLHEEAGMQHVYPLLPLIRQGRAARRTIRDLLRS